MDIHLEEDDSSDEEYQPDDDDEDETAEEVGGRVSVSREHRQSGAGRPRHLAASVERTETRAF